MAKPQWEAVTVGYVAAPGSLLSTPMLADTMAKEVGRRTVTFFLQAELKLKEEEEKERRRQREVAAYEARMLELDRRVFRDEQLTPEESYAWRKWAGPLPGERGPRRVSARFAKAVGAGAVMALERFPSVVRVERGVACLTYPRMFTTLVNAVFIPHDVCVQGGVTRRTRREMW